MPVMRTLHRLKNLPQNLHFLFLLNGILVATFFFFGTESKYEAELFTAISKQIKDSLPKNYSKESFALKATETAYQLEESRYLIFGKQHINGIKANFFRPSTFDLMTGNGACASYAAVLARILKSDDMQVRIGQMKVNGYYGGHMFVETKTESGWVVLDPMFNLVFKNGDGKIAGFKELQQNWNQYQLQLPVNYKAEYNFQEVRYTNWEKIPVITPAIKSMLDFFVGKEKADLISIRPYLLRNYHKLAWVTGIFLLISLLQTARIYKRKKNNYLRAKNSLKTSLELKIPAA